MISSLTRFIRHDSVQLFKALGAGGRLTDLWVRHSDITHKILSSEMVQGMRDNSLTREKFDNLYMKPDVLYIYNLGVALKERSAKLEKRTKSNISMIADMFMGYETEHNRFAKYNLKFTDILNDQRCIEHTNFLSKNTSIHEYYVAILTDMMPYVAFANYLFNSIDTDDNIWMAYAKKYGSIDGQYASQKLRKSIELANHVLNRNMISDERAAELFYKGLDFERYFIEEAMKGNLLPKITSDSADQKSDCSTTNQYCPPSSSIRILKKDSIIGRIIKMPSYDSSIITLVRSFDITLVDLDGVVLDPTHICLKMYNDQEYNDRRYQKLLNAGYTHQEIYTQYYELAKKTDYTPVSAKLIERLSHMSQHKMVLGFSARAPHFAHETTQHLHQVGMRFSNITQLRNYQIFKNGVIFMGAEPSKPTTEISKGEAILKLFTHLRSNGINIGSVLFIDDLLKNLESVNNSLKEQEPKIEFLGVHYTDAYDTLHRNFSQEELEEIANIQHSSLNLNGFLPSNEEVSEFIAKDDSMTISTDSTDAKNNDDELSGSFHKNANTGLNKTIPITTKHEWLSLQENEHNPEYDETNTTHIAELLQRHQEEIYGDLRFDFDDDIKSVDLTSKEYLSKDLDENNDISYIPDWLSSLLAGEPSILSIYLIPSILMVGTSHALHHHAHGGLIQELN